MYGFAKRPGDTIRVPFDLSDFVAEVVSFGAAASSIVFTSRSDVGVSVSSESGGIGQITLVVSGGILGRVYAVGVEAVVPGGRSTVRWKNVRVRSTSPFDGEQTADTQYFEDDYVELDYVE